MGKSSQRKGADGERELANLIRDMWGYEVKRGQVFNHQSDMVGLKGIHPEVKRVERLNIHKAMEQSRAEAEKRRDGIPCVFHRINREGWLVTMDLENFMDMYGAWYDERYM